MADNYLPGGPSKRLVASVKSQLRYFGIAPKDEVWRPTWTWASAIARSYAGLKPSWPLAWEIAAQYVFLLLCRMRAERALKLPFRAHKQVPENVAALLEAAAAVPMSEYHKKAGLFILTGPPEEDARIVTLPALPTASAPVLEE